MQNKKFDHVGCYVRVSTENQLENYSIEEQTQRLKAYCAAKDWTIFQIYTDPGYSGGNTSRPALQQMLADIQAGRLDMVAVYKLDRLSRSQKDTLTLIEDEFLGNHVEFVSMNENFDTSTPFGRAMIGILSVFAQLEKDQITERFTMGRIGRSKAGYYHGGPTPPTGYRYIDGKLIADPYKAAQIREVYSRFLSGYSIHSIQRYMHEKYGGWNSHTLVVHVLRNSTYIGKVKFKGEEYNGLQHPLVSKAKYERVQQLLNGSSEPEKKGSVQKTPFRAGYLLSSLIHCAQCGARYSANHGCYKCYSRAKSDCKYVKNPDCKNKNWPIEALDSLILRQLKTLQFDGTYIQSLQNKEPNAEANTEGIAFRINELERQINRIIGLYQVGSIPAEQIAERIEALQKEKNTLLLQLTELPKKKTSKRYVSAVNQLDALLQNGSLEEKRLFVSSLIDAILIDGENIQIKWRI